MRTSPAEIRTLFARGAFAACLGVSITLAFAAVRFATAAETKADAGSPAPIAMPGAAASAAGGPMGSAVFDWAKLEVLTTKTGERREFFNSPTATLANCRCHVTTLEPGVEAHAAHRHPDEEIIVVKEGTLEVTINGVAQRAGAGSVFFFASNDLHKLQNVGTTRASYHVFRIVTAATPHSPEAR